MNELQQATPSPLFPGMWPQAASALTREAHSLEPCLDDSDGCQDKALPVCRRLQVDHCLGCLQKNPAARLAGHKENPKSSHLSPLL